MIDLRAAAIARTPNGKEWGRWRFDAEAFSLDLDSQYFPGDEDAPEEEDQRPHRAPRYYILLDDIQTPKGLLSVLNRQREKRWGKETFVDLYDALSEMFPSLIH